MKNLMEDLNPMIKGEGGDRKIFKEHTNSNFKNTSERKRLNNNLGRKAFVAPSLA